MVVVVNDHRGRGRPVAKLTWREEIPFRHTTFLTVAPIAPIETAAANPMMSRALARCGRWSQGGKIDHDHDDRSRPRPR